MIAPLRGALPVPGSQVPFARLRDLTSDGVHNLDDVESAERFDECRDLFEMLFQKLLRDRQTQRLYRERLTSLKRFTIAIMKVTTGSPSQPDCLAIASAVDNATNDSTIFATGQMSFSK